MRKLVPAMMAVFVFMFAMGAYGADVSFTPPDISATLEAGTVSTVPVSVTVSDGKPGRYLLSFAVDGELPADWVKALNTWAYLDMERTDTLQSTVSIVVPDGAEGGTYTAAVVPRVMVMGTHGFLDVKSSIPVTVIVPAAGCTDVPGFVTASIEPDSLWAPNKKLVNVAISGTVEVPKGCTVGNAWYEISDSYGEMNSRGALGISKDGSFGATVQVEASRKGQDKDERVYTINLSAFFEGNEQALGKSAPFYVKIAHDQARRKK
jgi:hypothetical protein